MEELIKRLERVIQTGAPDKDGQHPISAEAVLEVVKEQLGTNLAEVGTDCISRQAAIDALRAMQTYKLFAGDDMLLIDQAGAQTELMLLPPAELSTNLASLGTDLISRQAAIDYFVINVGFHDEDGYPIEDTDELRKIWTEYFDGIPSAEPKRGEWIDKGITGDWQYQTDGRGRSWHEWQCDQCKDMVKKRSFYCPNCGADMREVTT